MAHGTARQVARGRVALLVALAGLASLSASPTVLRAEPLPDAVPVTPLCRAAVANEAATRAEALPHLAAKLGQRSVVRVLVMGTSSAASNGPSPASAGYAAQLEEILEAAFKGVDVVIVNRGVSGEGSAATSGRLKTEVALTEPDLVLWQVGTNDAMARVPAEDFATTVRDTIGWLKEHGIDTVLIGPKYGRKAMADEHFTAIREALREVAESENVLLVRRWEMMRALQSAGAMTSEDALVGDTGARCMAEHIARLIVASALLRPQPAAATP